jgi:hypothetical protein
MRAAPLSLDFSFFEKRGAQAVQAVQKAAGIAKSMVGFGRLGADTPTAMDNLTYARCPGV